MKRCVGLSSASGRSRKGTAGIYNRRPDEFDAKTGDHAKLDAIRRRLLLAEKEH